MELDSRILVVGRNHQEDDPGEYTSQVTERADGIFRQAGVGGRHRGESSSRRNSRGGTALRAELPVY
jgi:hypothetical protein